MSPHAPCSCAVVAALALALPGGARTEDALPLAAQEVKQRWHSRLDGRHFSARVRLEMQLAGLRERRELRVWRDDGEARGERLLVRFDAPPDLRDLGLLYLAHGDRPNDYFLYQPSTRRVRRLPDSVVNDDIYGIDLEFLGFGVAQTEPTEIEDLELVSLRGRQTYRLRERATRKNPRFEERTTWLDADTFVAVRTEHVRDGSVALVAEVLSFETIDGVATPLRMTFHRADGDRTVDLFVEEVDYAAPIPEDYFSVMALVRKSRGE